MAKQSNGIWQQIVTLTAKDLKILVLRHFSSTLYTAILLPVLLTVYVGIGQSLSGANNNYGIAEPRQVRSLRQALDVADSSRSNFVFVNNGYSGGDIDRVINTVASEVEFVVGDGMTAHRVSDVTEMGRICTVTFQATTSCYGGIVFHSSPNEGEGGIWNYTLRGDGDLGRTFDYQKSDNDPQVYILPLQRSIDRAIAQLGGTNSTTNLDSMEEMLFTNQTDTERRDEANRSYQNTFVRYMGVTILLAFYGMPYHLAGYIATEREKGLSALIDAMMTTTGPWQAQVVRIVSYFCSFSMVYLQGWMAGALILKFMIWKQTSVGVVLPYFILAGLAAAAQALIGGTLFRKAQLSGVVNGLVFLLLGVLVQAVNLSTGAAAILGLLFTPCNMILQIKYISRYEAEGRLADLLQAPENSDHSLPAYVLWIFLLVQICICPFIAAGLERWLHDTAANGRIMWRGSVEDERPQFAVTVQGLTKTFRPSLLSRTFGLFSSPRPATTAVDNLDLAVPRGQIVSLLGANGSGKSTTLDAIAGIQAFQNGKMTVDASGGIGIAPQRNVMWDELTVMEHVTIFNRLKSPGRSSAQDGVLELIMDVGLEIKKDVKSSTLSGGQKRKLQLAMMLTGGSAVCCVDEVSSGIDPLSRQKIWDILLAERGSRTIILTTHFLDEAEQLSDKVAIMSKGGLRVQGSVAELKSRFGSGYRFPISNEISEAQLPEIDGVYRVARSDSIVYIAPTAADAARAIPVFEAANLRYSVANPTLEDVFLQSADEYTSAVNMGKEKHGRQYATQESSPIRLLPGRQISIAKQIGVLMRKRLILLRSNWLPYLIAFTIPIIAASIMQLLVTNEPAPTCTPIRLDQRASMDMYNDAFDNATMLVGLDPSSANLSEVLDSLGRPKTLSFFGDFESLPSVVETERSVIKPGGYWDLGPQPIVVYRADEDFMASAVISQNLADSLQTGIDIVASYTTFDSTFSNVGKTLQLAIYISVALGIAPSFLALYPNLERRSHVRGLQYSSGVRVISLWTSHIAFDTCVIIIPVIVAALIFNFTSDAFWNAGYLVPIFLLFTIAATLLGYVFSLAMGSQLATWAIITAFNAVGLAIYFISFVFIISLSETSRAQGNVEIAHDVIAIIFPVGSLIRAMVVSLNVFSQACYGPELVAYAGDMKAYGAPILYLTLQCIVYFCILLLSESKTRLATMFHKQAAIDTETPTNNSSGVQVQSVTKKFDDSTAVENITFNVEQSETFALLGPNGAGKSTTISMIRGDISPTKGDILVSQTSITQSRALARANLGVCPQFDAIDAMTTSQHLQHYARLRGILDINRQVDAVLIAVGLEEYRNTMASHLSGGNKRKLSLGMALTGNPSVILLDEPSSGLDAAAKRIMWRTLQTVMPGRAILLTTHSMEEATVLAGRAGIIAKQMLATGKVEDLQRALGDVLHVHLVSKTAPYSSQEEMVQMRAGILELLPEAEVQERTFHGQLRFSVAAGSVLERSAQTPTTQGKQESKAGASSAMGQLLVLLETNKERMGVDHYSVSPTTLNDVFLAVVGQHQVQEEGYSANDQSRAAKKRNVPWRKMLIGF